MKTVIAVQARLSSTRLPRKVLEDLNGRPMLAQIVRRCRAVPNAQDVVISCPGDDLKDIMKATGLPLNSIITGPEEDILTRLLNVATVKQADRVVRITADCPLIPPDGIAYGISQPGKLVQNWRPRIHPDGFDFDIWETEYLWDLDKRLLGKDREWFAQWAIEHDGPGTHVTSNRDLSRWRLTVDYPEDLDLVRAIYEEMGGDIWGASLVIQWCMRNPRLMKLNERYVKDFGARPVCS